MKKRTLTRCLVTTADIECDQIKVGVIPLTFHLLKCSWCKAGFQVPVTTPDITEVA